MTKVSLSISVDSILLDKLVGKNKSTVINQILARALKTEEGIKTEIKYHEDQAKVLKKELEDLVEGERSRIENIPEKLKTKLVEVKNIVYKHPDKIYIWTDIINREYKQLLTADDLQRAIERWVK